MSRFFQAVQWLLAIAILLFFLGVFSGMLFLSWWYAKPRFLVNAPLPVAQSNSSSLEFNYTPTRTPFLPMPSRTPYLTMQASPTKTITATFTDEPTLTQQPSETPSPTIAFLPTDPIPGDDQPVSELPPQAYLQVSGFGQMYTLDCEARSAVDLAAYFGIQIGEREFLDMLPRSDDPEEGFVGNYWDELGQIPPASYGVHAAPVARLLRAYGLNAWEQKGMSWESLKAEIASGRPVMVWVIGNTSYGYPVTYTSPTTGNTTIVAHYEHTVLVTGYDPTYVTLLDPNGAVSYQRTLRQFLDSWAVLGNMAVVVSP